jgi:hypothetical protein
MRGERMKQEGGSEKERDIYKLEKEKIRGEKTKKHIK